jgi:flavin-dependent dehydrogenase
MTACEALVVGAGPAGSVTAAVLATAGVRVRLVDRARFPRPKLCGDTLNPGAFAVLQQLETDGPVTGLCARLRARALPIAGMTVSGPDGTAVIARYPSHVRGLSISRSELDLMLIERAAGFGVDIVEGIRAVAPVLERGRVAGIRVESAAASEWRARVVIIADGRGSRLASSLGLSQLARRPRRWAFGGCFSGVPTDTGLGEMHLRNDGYIGVSPLPDGLTNVCVVRTLTAASAGRLSQQTIIPDTIAADRWLSDRFSSAQRESPVMSLGPLAVDASGGGVPGALLAGDAAGFIDPMTGDGLRFALRGGVLAAQAALDELSTGQPSFQWLERQRQHEFGNKWRFNRALRWMAGSPAALAAASRLTAHWPAPIRLIVREAGDVRRSLPAHAGDADRHVRAQSGVW